MRKFSKTLAASGLVVLSLGMTGCQNLGAPAAPQKAPEVVLQEGMAKLADVTSYGYDLGLKGDLTGPAGQPPEKVNFDLKLKGNVDAKDPKDPRFNLSLSGSMMADADGGSGELSFRLNKDALFINLMKLDGKGSVTIPEEMKEQLIGKWWTLPIPPEALEEMAKSMPQGGSENLTEEQKKMKELVDQTKFFKNVEYKGMESVGGEQSYHYTGMLDEDAFMAFVAKAAEMQGQPMSEGDQAEMKEAMQYVDFSGDMYVGQNSGVLNKVKGNLTFTQDAEKSTPSGTITIEFMVSDLNKPVTVEVPADAQPIPMEALGGLPL